MPTTPPGITPTIVKAEPEHLSPLPAIERAAAALFPSDLLPEILKNEVTSLADLARAQQAGRLWVALISTTDNRYEQQPVGFALASTLGSDAFLVEMDVHPDYQQQGLGRALITTVAHWAKDAGYARLTLTTFAELPWNAPFYQRMGFEVLSPENASEALREKLLQEQAAGLRGRVSMCLKL